MLPQPQPTPALAELPGLTPPPGVIPNLVNPHSIGTELAFLAILHIVLTVLLTAIRMFTKIRLIKAYGWEDCKCSSPSLAHNYFDLPGARSVCRLSHLLSS